MENNGFFELVVAALLVVLVAFGLGAFNDMLRKNHKLSEKCAALLKEVDQAKAAKPGVPPSPAPGITAHLNSTTARLLRLVEESQQREIEAHSAAQRAYDRLVAESKENSERLLGDLRAAHALLRDALEKCDRLTAENTELSKELYALRLKLAVLEGFHTKKPVSLPPPTSGSLEKPSLALPFFAGHSHTSRGRLSAFQLLYGDEINLTAAIPDKPFDYLSDETDIQTKDKRLYRKTKT